MSFNAQSPWLLTSQLEASGRLTDRESFPTYPAGFWHCRDLKPGFNMREPVSQTRHFANVVPYPFYQLPKVRPSEVLQSNGRV